MYLTTKIKHFLIALSLILPSYLSFASNIETSEQYVGVNNITFYDSQYNNPFAGNGFLITHENKLYAVTVKHVLFEAKTPAMKSISIDNYISHWKIHPNNKVNEFVTLGKLLNSNKNERIDMDILSKDWLVFEVLENKSNLKVLKLRASPLLIGETLTAYGCSYINKGSCIQDEYKGTLNDFNHNNLRVTLPDLSPTRLRGLSGSPVIDQQGLVVGIVSNILKNKNHDGFDFAPASLDYLLEVLSSIQSK